MKKNKPQKTWNISLLFVYLQRTMVQIQKINFSYLKDLKEAVCEYRLFSFYTFAFNKFSATLNFSQPINHLLAVVAILPITHVNPEGCAFDARTLEDELVKLLIHQPT